MADSLERGQAELERSNAELKRSNAELEQFASVTSHDLQAPLTTISMYAELLERRHGPEPDGGHDLINGIRGATTQARTLIRDLLEYSRAGRGDLSVEPLRSELVVNQALEALAGSIESTGRARAGRVAARRARRSLQPLPRLPEPHRQRREVHARRGPRGRHRAPSATASTGAFEIRDNGIGMDPESTQRIFEPFRRLHGEEDYPGTGIGLAVCERIVEQHGGRIWVSSDAGEGSVFSFTMPAGELATRSPRSRPSAQAPVAASTLMRRARIGDRASWSRSRLGACGGGDGEARQDDGRPRARAHRDEELHRVRDPRRALQAGARGQGRAASTCSRRSARPRSSTPRCATACWTCTPSTSACCCRRSTRSSTGRRTRGAAYAARQADRGAPRASRCSSQHA